ncbi:MAG: cytidylate kinase family protein [Deltaproteobacteria bacterium]|nr:cytidylate kinase family protein [Deltaproteobacteria bacterium]
MSIITISRGSYSRGKEVAEKLAQRLRYECISREILIEASEQFNIPEIKLVRAIQDAPSILDRFTYGKEKYIAYIRAALLSHVQSDNVVYHGNAGHFFLQKIPNVLKVRITSAMESRVQEEMKRENIPAEKARHILEKDDAERRKWGLRLYGVDTWDSRLYDIVLHIETMSIDDAINIIYYALQRPSFQTTPDHQKLLNDLALAARVEAELVEELPTAKVTALDGVVFVDLEIPLSQTQALTEKARAIAKVITGVKAVKVSAIPLGIEE